MLSCPGAATWLVMPDSVERGHVLDGNDSLSVALLSLLWYRCALCTAE